MGETERPINLAALRRDANDPGDLMIVVTDDILALIDAVEDARLYRRLSTSTEYSSEGLQATVRLDESLSRFKP